MESNIAGDERQRSGRIREKRYKEENEHEKTEYIDMRVIVRPNCNQFYFR